MNWHILVKKLKEAGYDGEDKDLDAVKAFISEKFDGVEHDGKAVDPDALFKQAYPKLDVTNEAKEAEIERRFEAKFEELSKTLGMKPKRDDTDGGHDHQVETKDVKVGKARILDDPKGGFKHAGEFVKAVAAAGGDEGGASFSNVPEPLTVWHKASLSTYANEQTGADGGFAVPPEFRDSIVKRVTGEASLISRCDQLNLSRNSITIPVDEDEPWSSSGIVAYWEGEAGTLTQTKPVLKDRTWRARKLTALVPVTDELLEDAPALGMYVQNKAGEKLEFKANNALIHGTGTGQPLGILNSAALISVAKESSQTADTIKANNILKMWKRMYPPYMVDAVWLANGDTIDQLAKMFIQGVTDAGTGVAAGGLVYQPPNGLADAPFGRLMGRPVILTQHCETLGDKGDIILCDLRQYLVALKSGGVETASSIHLWFDQAVTAFRLIMRMDGQPWNNTTITPRDGSNTMSAFVTLAARG